MVQILDTTLREGEQTPGVTFKVEEKLKIAALLDDFGIDIIEVGHPRVSPDIFRGVKEIAKQGYRADILAHCRALEEDIDIARSCDVEWVGIFFCVSNQRLEQQFRLDIDKAVRLVTKAIEYAKSYGLKVRYTPEDSVRTEYSSLLKISKAAHESGADRISIADTVGAMTPKKIFDLFCRLKQDLDIKFNVHCHNDLGLATANSLSAFEAGASMIDVSVNGLGERVGIAPLSEISVALKCMYNINNNWKLEMLPEISQFVSKVSGINVPANAPIIGENAFVHNAGLHVAAVINNPGFYEVIPVDLIGKKRDFIIDKMASIETVKHKLKQLKIKTRRDDILRLMKYVKSREKGTISDYEIISVINEPMINGIAYQ